MSISRMVFPNQEISLPRSNSIYSTSCLTAGDILSDHLLPLFCTTCPPIYNHTLQFKYIDIIFSVLQHLVPEKKKKKNSYSQ